MDETVTEKHRVSPHPISFVNRLFSFSTMLFGLLLTGVYFFCSHRSVLADPDIWWHLRNAQYLVQHHVFLRQDIYSFTIYGRPWVNAEWLAEIPYYFAWHWFGYRGLYLLTIGMIESLLAGCCLLGWQRSRNVRPALLVSGIFLLLATVSLGPRTLMFGWICLMIELGILRAFSKGRDYLWGMPLLFALWVNLHGSWPVGLLFLFVYIASRWKEVAWGAIYSEPLAQTERQRLLLIFGSCVLALFLNPYGWHLVIYPFVITMQHHLTVSTVEEWQSLDFHSFRGRLFFTLLAGLLLTSMVRRRRWQLHELLFALIAILAALTYSRFLLLAGIVLSPLLARELSFFEPDNREIDKPVLNAVILCLLAAFVVSHVPDAETLKQQSELGYPAKAVAYLKAAPSAGRMMNDFNWGGYLLWNMPETPVFIDSRADAYEQWGVFADSMEVVKLVHSKEIVEKYRIRRALFPKDAPVILLLRESPEWAVEYEDDTAVVMRRTAP